MINLYDVEIRQKVEWLSLRSCALPIIPGLITIFLAQYPHASIQIYPYLKIFVAFFPFVVNFPTIWCIRKEKRFTESKDIFYTILKKCSSPP